MRIFLGITDNSWFDFLAGQSRLGTGVDEVNFWRPSGKRFLALSSGELFLFKLHAPRNVIAGGAFFTRAVRLSIRWAWETFGFKNGTQSEAALAERISKYLNGKQPGVQATLDHEITCIILSEPFFFPPEAQIPVPADFSRYTQVGFCYRTEEEAGYRLFAEVQERLGGCGLLEPGPAQFMLAETPRFGDPLVVAPRLGQGGFRIGVLEAYRRRCAITGERTLPVLDAAHIRPYSDGGGHELRNGLLLRRDLHRLFDLGYLAVRPEDQTVQISHRIRAEFENGREYYALQGRRLAAPLEFEAEPAAEFLRYHYENIYRG